MGYYAGESGIDRSGCGLLGIARVSTAAKRGINAPAIAIGAIKIRFAMGRARPQDSSSGVSVRQDTKFVILFV